jgi:integrase/recombinase XerD
MKSSFKEYLAEYTGLAESSIATYQKSLAVFENWLYKEQIKPAEIGIADVINFLGYLQEQQATESNKRMILTILRHYFNYLIHTKHIHTNPAQGIYVKPSMRTVGYAPLSQKQLQGLYENFEVTNHSKSLEHKVLIGLLVYQGIAVTESKELKMRDIYLNEGKIRIPKQSRINGRVLKLEGNQIYYLQAYIVQQNQKNKHSEYLFTNLKDTTYKGKLNSNYVTELMKKLKPSCGQLKNASHIRQSVIAQWTKDYDLRMVQYMAGHKWISSTQRYDQVSLETLQAELEEIHPLNSFKKP